MNDDLLKFRAIVTTDNEYIPLKFIESINRYHKDECDRLVDKLKDHELIRVTTLSGHQYEVSLKEMKAHLTQRDGVNVKEDEIWKSLFNSWMNTLK